MAGVTQPPPPELRDLPRFQQRIRSVRVIVGVVLGLGLVGGCCAGFGAGEPIGLIMPATYLVASVVGGALLLWSLTRAAAAIDAAAWTVSAEGLTAARALALAAGGVLAAGAVLTPAGLAVQSKFVTFAVFATPVLVLVLLVPTAVAFVFARHFQRLVEWHRTAPPEALRPPPNAGFAQNPVFPPHQPPTGPP